MTRWRCRKCKRLNPSKRTMLCATCGARRKVRRSKHAVLLETARPLYDELLAKQGGRCAVCLRVPSATRRLDIDHDHATLTVRGLLCHKCNRALPSWITAAWLRAAADYLEALGIRARSA